MAKRSSMLASDADREQIADRLRQATAEGRLLAHELEERLSAALRARTYGELDVVVADLPATRIARHGRSEIRHWAAPALALAIAIPVVIAVVSAVVFVVTGFFAGWMLWMLVAWWVFGRRHRRHHHGPGTPPSDWRGPRARPGAWF